MFKILDTKKRFSYLKSLSKHHKNINSKNILELVCFFIDFHQILDKFFMIYILIYDKYVYLIINCDEGSNHMRLFKVR